LVTAPIDGGGPAPSGHEMFAGLRLRAARPGRTCAAPVSLLAHAAALTVLIALSLSRVAPSPPLRQDPLRIPIFGAPAALPPLPKGDGGAARPTRPRPPDPPAFTAPVETAPVAPIVVAPAEDLAPSTGSPVGSDDGIVDGSEAGKPGGQPGGVPWGVRDGIVGGTGDLPFPVTNADRPPRLLHRVQPVYPPPAFSQKVEGTVKLEILIDASGRVRRATVLQSIPMLDAAAVDAVLQWVFAPATKDGRPVATLALAPVRFQIY
jgi:protein TonB